MEGRYAIVKPQRRSTAKEVIDMNKRLRHSPQRDRIYEYLIQSVDHPSAEMIYSALRTQLPNLSMGTVYRNLSIMERDGEIGKIEIPCAPARYDKTSRRHEHVICEKCGRVFDLGSEDLTDYFSRLAKRPVTGYRLTLYTVCEDCKKETGSSLSPADGK